MATTSILFTAICLPLVVLLYSFWNIRHILQSWKYLLRGRAIMLDYAQRSPRTPYALFIPGNRLHVMSSREHWTDLNNAQTSQLSPNAASREMFQPKYTFGFDWSAPREQVSLATVRSIRNMTLQLPRFQARFVDILDQEFKRAIMLNPKEDGWTRVPMWETVQRAVTRINSLFLLGGELAHNEEFTTRGLNFISQTTLILELVRIVPSFPAPLVTKMIKGRGLEQKYVFDTLRTLVEKREAYKRSTLEESRKKPVSFLEGAIDYLQDDRSTQQNVAATNTTWVISTLAIPVVTCQLLQDLYTHPDLLAELKEEAASVPLRDPDHLNEISDKLERLPLLEAFAMESMRTKCFQSNTAHRVAMKTFKFSDGYTVPAGDAVEFHQRGLFNDESYYPDYTKFEPSRFLNKNRSLVDTGFDWPFWGVPRYICPGRWHVANVQRLMAVYLMQNFEAKIEDTKDMNFEWRDALVPNPKTILLVRSRSQ